MLVRREDGAVVADDLRRATTPWARLRGLMGRRALASGEALWLEPCGSIHMMFMRFAIDVLFLRPLAPEDPRASGSEGLTPGVEVLHEVLMVRPRVRPWVGSAWCRGAEVAVELEAGRAAATGVREGDVLLCVEAVAP